MSDTLMERARDRVRSLFVTATANRLSVVLTILKKQPESKH